MVGEAQLPLGPEIEDAYPRSLQLPISKLDRHAGAVWIEFGLKQKEDVAEEPHADSALTTFASVAAGAVGEAVNGSVAVWGAMLSGTEGRARTASLKPRRGFGTCA